MECGIHKDRLQFLAMWTPKEGVDDFARTSRAVVLGVINEIAERIQDGWRPDESLTGLRASGRIKAPLEGLNDCLFGACAWETRLELGSDDAELVQVNTANVDLTHVLEEKSEKSGTLFVVYDTKTLLPECLHVSKGNEVGDGKESRCGKTMGRDIRVWKEHSWATGCEVSLPFFQIVVRATSAATSSRPGVNS